MGMGCGSSGAPFGAREVPSTGYLYRDGDGRDLVVLTVVILSRLGYPADRVPLLWA